MQKRFSIKRQAILNCIMSTKEHPSAEWIYTKLKPIYPTLSLATVYRNLNQMKEEGLIRSMGFILGKERFDADTSPHTHAICNNCGKIIDIPQISVSNDFLSQASELSSFTLWTSDLQFSGLCDECNKKLKENEK